MTVPEKKQMNAGVELLLERMKTHPEEFTEQGKWVGIMQDIHKYAEKEESDTLNGALKALMMQKVTERVLEGLVDPKDSNLKELLKAKLNATPLGGATQGGYTLTTNGAGQHAWVSQSATGQTSINANSITLGQTTLQEQELQHMKAHLEYMKMQQASKHETMFGKLYNYLGVNK